MIGGLGISLIAATAPRVLAAERFDSTPSWKLNPPVADQANPDAFGVAGAAIPSGLIAPLADRHGRTWRVPG